MNNSKIIRMAMKKGTSMDYVSGTTDSDQSWTNFMLKYVIKY